MTGHLIICRGIPGSGKSYWAAQQSNVIVVTRDDIRTEYNCIGEGWSKEKELDFVIPEMNKRIRDRLIDGRTVISADTNINPLVVDKLIALATKSRATFEIKDFDTPLDVCIERDSKRQAPYKVGESRIREYYASYMKVLGK